MYHAKKDLKSFYVLMALFLFTGIALKIYLNERPFEPRERDYALVGSFYVFAIWIGFGVYSLYESAKAYLQPKNCRTHTHFRFFTSCSSIDGFSKLG